MFDSLAETLANSISPTSGLSRSYGEKYFEDPNSWLTHAIIWGKNESPTVYQHNALRDLVDRHRVSVRGPHGIGKTALFSLALLWFSTTREAMGVDWKIPTTASVWRQLEKFLWPEIHKWTRKLRWDVLGRVPFTEKELLKLSLKLEYGEAFALASDRSETIEGAHADEILYIFDEAKIVPDDTWDSAEGAFSTGNAYWLSASTPGEPSGRFFQIQMKKPGFADWSVHHVSLEDAIAANRIKREWAEQRKIQWGEESAVYKNRVLGEFAASEADSIIPLPWVEAAVERWYAVTKNDKFTCIGVDVARYGEDKTCLAFRYENLISQIVKYERQDTMETTGRVAMALDRLPGYAIVDVIGIGAGVVDRLLELEYSVIPFASSEGTVQKDKSGLLGFLNKRSHAWWRMRELLDPANDVGIALPPDDSLIGDLTAPRWKVNSSGKIQVESKDSLRDRLKRSTDSGDAVVMAFYEESSEGILVSWESLEGLGKVEDYECRWA